MKQRPFLYTPSEPTGPAFTQNSTKTRIWTLADIPLSKNPPCKYQVIENSAFDKYSLQPYTLSERAARINATIQKCENFNLKGNECNGFLAKPAGQGLRHVDNPFSLESRILTVNERGNQSVLAEEAKLHAAGTETTHYSVLRVCPKEPSLVQLSSPQTVYVSKNLDDNEMTIELEGLVKFQEHLKGRLYYMDKITHEDKLISRDVNEIQYYKSNQTVFEKVASSESAEFTWSRIYFNRKPMELMNNGFRIKIMRKLPKCKPGIYSGGFWGNFGAEM